MMDQSTCTKKKLKEKRKNENLSLWEVVYSVQKDEKSSLNKQGDNRIVRREE